MSRNPIIHIRVKQNIKDWIKVRAERNKRSVNSELNFILENEIKKEMPTVGSETSLNNQPKED